MQDLVNPEISIPIDPIFYAQDHVARWELKNPQPLPGLDEEWRLARTAAFDRGVEIGEQLADLQKDYADLAKRYAIAAQFK